MKLHYSLLTVAIAFIIGGNLFAMDASEANQSEQKTLEQLNEKVERMHKQMLKQSIDTTQHIIRHKWIEDEDKGIIEDTDNTFYARLKNGKMIRCFNQNNDVKCHSYKNTRNSKYKSASPQFFAILQKMYEKQQESQVK